MKSLFHSPRLNAYLIDRILVSFFVLEAHLIPSITGLLSLFAVPVFHAYGLDSNSNILFCSYSDSSDLSDPFIPLFASLQFMIFTALLPILLIFINYHFLHMYIDKHLYKKLLSHRKWYHLFDILALPVSGIFLMTLPSCVSGLRRLIIKEEEYIVSEKQVIEH